MKQRQVRWVCSKGIHPGVLGPSKPRKDNIVRYCLPCSEKAGRLVERKAPALEKARADKQETRRARAMQEAERTKEQETAYYTVAGIDLRKEMRRLATLPVFGGRTSGLYRRPPALTITRRSYRPSRFGSASPSRNRIWISDYKGIDAADVRETLLHEMVHINNGYDPSDTAHWHGTKFRSTLRVACEEAYGFRPQPQGNHYHGSIARGLRERNL